MVASPRTFLRGALSFGVLGFLVGFVAIDGVSLVTYIAGAAAVGAAWMMVPVNRELAGLVRERSYLLGPIALLWPLSGLPVLLFVLIQLAERPREILAGALLASAAMGALALPHW